jgi:hypothetical protein
MINGDRGSNPSDKYANGCQGIPRRYRCSASPWRNPNLNHIRLSLDVDYLQWMFGDDANPRAVPRRSVRGRNTAIRRERELGSGTVCGLAERTTTGREVYYRRNAARLAIMQLSKDKPTSWQSCQMNAKRRVRVSRVIDSAASSWRTTKE